MKLRTAALLAAIAQVLVGITTIWPEVIGSSELVVDEGMPIWIKRSINVFVLAAVLVFYIVIFLNSDRLRIPQLLKKVSLWATVMIGFQNLGFTLGNVRAVLFRSQNLLQWQYHPFDQLSYVLSPLIPTVWVASTMLFLIATSRRPGTLGGPSADTHARRYTAMVKGAATLAAAGAATELGAVLYVSVHLRLLTLSSALQVAIDVFLLLFFALMCKGEVVSNSVTGSELKPA